MDALEIKRLKEREKKRKQREKLKQNKDKYEEVKKKDAERKKIERYAFRNEIMEHPRKYKTVIEKNNLLNQTRVKRFREKKKIELVNSSQNSNKIHPQKCRRVQEAKRTRVAVRRENDRKKKEGNRQRVINFRLRVRLLSNSENSVEKIKQSPITPTDPNSYQHKSSETRAYNRVMEKMPETPEKKVRIIEKIVRHTTPRSRKVLSESKDIMKVLSNPTKRKLTDDYDTLEAVTSCLSELNQDKSAKSSLKSVAKSLVKRSVTLSKAAKVLGLHRNTVRRNIKSNGRRKVHKNKLSSEVTSAVQNFYLEEASRLMPNKRDVILIRDKNGVKKELIQKQLMEMTQEEAFKKFKVDNPNVKVNKRKFDSLRPIQVRRTPVSARIVCCCTYCENIRLKTQALRCQTTLQFKSSSDVLESTLCPKSGPYHSINCIRRKCELCGTKLLKDKLKDVPADKPVSWKEWKKQTVPLDAERNVTRVALQTRENQFHEFIDNFCIDLESHAEHRFRSSWQYDQFRENVSSLKDGEIIMCMDFSENYTCRHGREVQSFHWNQRQVTLHPMMLYYIKDGELKKEGYTAITDDLKHDASAVAEFEKSAIQHVRDQDVEVKVVHQWTDGCAAQYKGRHSFAEISIAESKNKVKVIRNYFETGHGKGPCDGLGGIIKRKVTNAVLQKSNVHVSDAKELHSFCEENLKTVGESSFNSRQNKYAASSRTFKFFAKINRSGTTTVKTLLGSRKLHSVSSTGVGFQLKVRLLSCYCNGCQNGDNCENQCYVDKWEKKVLKPTEKETNQIAVSQSPVNEQETASAPVSPVPDSIQVNDFVAVGFTSKKSKLCYFARVAEMENNEFGVEYLERKDKMFWQYPDEPDKSWQNKSDILCKLPEPSTIVSASRVKLEFKLSTQVKDKLGAFKLC